MRFYKRRISKAYQNAKIVPFDNSSKFIIMSDCHRGQGDTADSSLNNQAIYFAALDHYYQNGFTYIELGDGDELWKNRDMNAIIDVHSDVFWLMSQFCKDDRLYMLYGNHDVVKKRSRFAAKYLSDYFCDSVDAHLPLFPQMEIYQSLILQTLGTKRRLFLLHGHQGSILNDLLWPLARFLVRYLWRPLESIGFTAPTGSARPHKQREKIERQLSAFAQKIGIPLIAGHTHRPVFPAPKEGLYFNDGSCVHPRCITAIEIENGSIALVKWSVSARADQTLYVHRQVLEGPHAIDRYFD